VPLLFIVRKGRWIRVQGLNFSQYLQKGFRGVQPTLDDWKLHLTSIFTEARFKEYLEIRSIDCQKTEIGLAAAALIKGLFYDNRARQGACKLLGAVSEKQTRDLALKAARMGLRTPFKGKNLQYFCERLYGLAGEGLLRLAGEGMAAPDEAAYLKPLGELLLKKQRTPAEELLHQVRSFNNARQKINHLIELTAICDCAAKSTAEFVADSK
jgi:glutamate--cysteine ligase